MQMLAPSNLVSESGRTLNDLLEAWWSEQQGCFREKETSTHLTGQGTDRGTLSKKRVIGS